MMQPLIRIFEQRVRGVRLIEAVGILLAVGMIFWVCLSKAKEDGDVKRLNDLDSQITDQRTQVDALKVRVAELERPARLEQMAVAYLGMKPVAATHEARIDALAEISRTTSKPVAASSLVIPANALVAGPNFGPGANRPTAPVDDLISTSEVKAAAAPTVKTVKPAGAL